MTPGRSRGILFAVEDLIDAETLANALRSLAESLEESPGDLDEFPDWLVFVRDKLRYELDL